MPDTSWQYIHRTRSPVTGKPSGFQVRPPKRPSRHFGISVHGGVRNAFLKAAHWRDRQLQAIAHAINAKHTTNSGEPYISRITEQARGKKVKKLRPTAGFQVNLPKKAGSKYFSLTRYGSAHVALTEAAKWRDKAIKKKPSRSKMLAYKKKLANDTRKKRAAKRQ